MRRVVFIGAMALAILLGVITLTWGAAQEAPEPRRFHGSGETPGDVVSACDGHGNELGSTIVDAAGDWSLGLVSDAAPVFFRVNGVAAGEARAADGQT